MRRPRLNNALKRFFLATVCGVWLAACSTVAPTPVNPVPTGVTSEEGAVAPQPAKPSREMRIERDTLLDILSAEIAARRMLGDAATAHMIAAVKRQPSPELAERAARMAHYFNNHPALELATATWQDLAPTASEPRYLRAIALTKQGHLNAAFLLMESLLQQGEETNFTAIVSVINQHPSERLAVQATVTRMRLQHPDNIQLIVSDAILADAANDAVTALEYSQQALGVNPDNYAAMHIKARSLQILGREDEAIETLVAALELYPETITMRMHLARMLTRRDLQAASEQFEALVKLAPKDASFRLSLALSLKETGKIEAATQHFNTLLDMGEFTDEANYYLAQIYAQTTPELAAGFCLDVQRRSQYFMPALALFIDIKSNQGQLLSALDSLQKLWLPEDEHSASIALMAAQQLTDIGLGSEAEHLLHRAILQLQDKVDIRYTLSILLQKRGAYAEAQQLLEQNIAQQPDHAASLNALGYLLAERGHDLQRAESLINQAIAIRPNDAAIIDSLGWVMHKQGQSEKAATVLTKAHKMLADPEIASHLIEVLWQLNRRIEAQDIIRDSLHQFPDSPELNHTLERLNIPHHPVSE